MKDWEKYKIGKKSSTNYVNTSCLPFSGVSHVTHINHFFGIIDKEFLQPRLVYDYCKLNKYRILVNWLSPNTWAQGYRYGSVKLDFDWNNLIKNRKFYWVEAHKYKNHTALRVLITKHDRSSFLEEYNPTLRNGPWYYDNSRDEHFYNSKYCLEFLFEDTIDISLIKALDFVKHHDDYCSIYRYEQFKCNEKGINLFNSAIRVIATFAERELKLSDYFDIKNDSNLKRIIEYALEDIFALINKEKNYNGNIISNSSNAKTLVSCINYLISKGENHNAIKLFNLFNTKDVLIKLLQESYSECTGLSIKTIKEMVKDSL